jgi:hypothetical protein
MQRPGTTPSTQEGAPSGQTPEGAAGQQTPESQTDQNQQAMTEERGGEASYDGLMFGDIIVPSSSFASSVTPQVLSLLGRTGTTPGTQGGGTAPRTFGGSAISAALFPYHTTFKIAENELPKPLDRVWVTYNYWSDVAASGSAAGTGAQVHREMAGGEKTFLDGNASVGIRVPVFWVFGSSGAASSQIGDISVVFKYAFINNRSTADAMSVGLVVSVPTGPSLSVPGQSSIHPTELVPWFGEIWHWGRLYNINFTSIAVPTDARDVTLFFESFALAYVVYRNSDRSRLLNAIVPDFEWHANVPLNHGSLSDFPIGYPTTVDFTGGCYFFMGRSVLGMAAGMPVTGPKPYGVEALVNFNFIF